MKLRVKKQEKIIVSRLETIGELKEILVNQDFLNPSNVSVSLCFRGQDSAGIVDLTPQELSRINHEISSRKKILKGVKILKFKK
jgi:hypothetical protein